MALTLNMVIQIITCRYISSLSLLRSAFISFSIGLFAVVLTETSVFLNDSSLPFNEFASLLITNLAIYSIFGYWYLIFITMSHIALRTQMVIEIHNSKAGLSMEEILNRYNSKDILEKRISRLINNRQLIYRDKKYFIGKSGILWYANLLKLMRFIILGEKGEFDFGTD